MAHGSQAKGPDYYGAGNLCWHSDSSGDMVFLLLELRI
jgi:hypothetical protein